MGSSEVIAQAMRMVVAMRHEFSINIDVRRLAEDRGYAREVIAQALGSRSERLREQAAELRGMLSAPSASPSPPAAAAAPAAASVDASDALDERAVSRKYQIGLR